MYKITEQGELLESLLENVQLHIDARHPLKAAEALRKALNYRTLQSARLHKREAEEAYTWAMELRDTIADQVKGLS